MKRWIRFLLQLAADALADKDDGCVFVREMPSISFDYSACGCRVETKVIAGAAYRADNSFAGTNFLVHSCEVHQHVWAEFPEMN